MFFTKCIFLFNDNNNNKQIFFHVLYINKSMLFKFLPCSLFSVN